MKKGDKSNQKIFFNSGRDERRGVSKNRMTVLNTKRRKEG